MSLENRVKEDLQHNLDWVTSRRWFGDKARPVTDVDVVATERADANGLPLLLTVARFSFAWGDDSLYFVPLLDGDAPIAEREASSDPRVLEWLISGFTEGRLIEGNATWRWRVVGDPFPDTGAIDYAAAKPISGEQSNTSIVFPGAFIGKVFRRIAPGLNPDLEIAEHLTQGTFTHAPALYGVLEVEMGDERIDLMAIQEFVPNVGDGWTWLLGQLVNPDERESLIDDVELLATRTAELHIALAEEQGNDEFAAEVIDHDAAEAIVQRVIAEMEASVEGLTHFLLPHEVEQLHKGLGALMGEAWSMVGTLQTRVHGDYHLGQTLRRMDGDFEIIDFEGEPSRTMDQRRSKQPPLKDVAGMVRSLDYAGSSLIQTSQDLAEREAIADWVTQATSAFVTAYRKRMREGGEALVPDGAEKFEELLNLMVAEKALYEIRYEMNNRPDWRWIPLNALKRLVGMEVD